MNTQKRILWAAFGLVLFAGICLAQDKETQLRTVRGQVIDRQDAPIPGAVVFLKNTRTQAVQSRIADDPGNYKFSGLDPNSDYEIHAEKDGAKSPTRTISSFDSRKDIVLNLKISRK